MCSSARVCLLLKKPWHRWPPKKDPDILYLYSEIWEWADTRMSRWKARSRLNRSRFLQCFCHNLKNQNVFFISNINVTYYMIYFSFWYSLWKHILSNHYICLHLNEFDISIPTQFSFAGQEEDDYLTNGDRSLMALPPARDKLSRVFDLRTGFASRWVRLELFEEPWT